IADKLVRQRFVTVQGVPCSAPHHAEVLGVFELPAGPYPGDVVVETRASTGCLDILESYSPTAAGDSSIGIMYFAPDRRTWGRDRIVVCIAEFEPQRTESLR